MKYGDLVGKKVLVTGASSGIGSATAELFAAQGAFVGVHYNRSRDGAERTLERVVKHSDGVLIRGDVCDPEQISSMVERFGKAAGGIDVLVNNAGTLMERRDYEQADIDYHDRMYQLNTRSVFWASRCSLDYLKLSRGCIVNVSSVAAHTAGGGGSGIYAAAKAAVAVETMAMAREFGKYGIRVNSVFPGLIETRFHEQFSSADRKARVAEQTPLGRNGSAEDVGKAILFLASSEASGFITGEYIAVNGGLYVRC